mgnify:CR=1 FL=1
MNDLTKYVGALVSVSTMYGTEYGMVDGVFCDQLGFVSGCETEWDTRLVNVQDVQECVTDDERTKARQSATWYYTNEIDSLQRRIKMQYKKDDPKKLQDMLTNCLKWFGGLQGVH